MSDPNVIDLTGDSPISGGIRQQRRRNGNVHLQDRVSSRPRINRLRSHMQNQLDDSVTLVIPDDNADEHFERHKILKNTGEVATFDGIISDESDEVPCINDSITGRLVPLTCPICFEQLSSNRKPMSMKCGHVFCAECLKMSLARIKKCPKCKKATTLQSCRRLYF